MNEYILAYDLGTSGVKAAIVDFEGRLLCYREEEYPLSAPVVGYGEQSTDDYWNAICKATRAAIAGAGIGGDEVVGVSCGTQGIGFIPVDAEGNALYNNITWIDSRSLEQAEQMNAKAGFEVANASDELPKMMWFKQNCPDLFARTKYYMGCTGYVMLRLTGRMVEDYTDGQDLYSTSEKWEATYRKSYEYADIDPALVPPLLPTGSYVGQVTEEAAAQLGITTKAAAYMGAVDVTVATVGAACGKRGDVHAYLGTSGWVSAIGGKEYVDEPCTGIFQYPSLDKDAMMYGGCVQAACLAFDWAIDTFYGHERETLGGGVYDFINQELAEEPAGSNGILATPWVIGERCPIMDEKTKTVFIGASTLTTRRDMVNAVMESISYSLRMILDYYHTDTGLWPEKIGVVGGGAQSNHWMQMMADIFATPVYRPENCRHTGAIGAAAIVAVGMGRVPVDELEKFVRIEKTFYPDPANATVYKERFLTWKKIYPALAGIFAEMA